MKKQFAICGLQFAKFLCKLCVFARKNFTAETQRSRVFLFAILFFFFSPLLWRGVGGEAFSQSISATSKIDSNEFLIGDWIKVKLEVKHPQNVPITWELTFDTLKGLEVVEIGKADTQVIGNELLEKRILTLSAFDSGNFMIPPFVFKYKKFGTEEIDSTITDPLTITVHTIPVDTTRAIKPIKDPLSVPFSFADIQYYVYGAILLAAIIWGIYYWNKKRKKKIVPVVEYAPKIPPHEIALEKLKKVEEEKLWQKGEMKLYHTKVTEVIREYIERRFLIPALESTTDELLDNFQSVGNNSNGLKSAGVNGEVKNKLRELLVMADLVKFAKAKPLPDENEKSLKLAVEFVKETIEEKSVEEKPIMLS